MANAITSPKRIRFEFCMHLICKKICLHNRAGYLLISNHDNDITKAISGIRYLLISSVDICWNMIRGEKYARLTNVTYMSHRVLKAKTNCRINKWVFLKSLSRVGPILQRLQNFVHDDLFKSPLCDFHDVHPHSRSLKNPRYQVLGRHYGSLFLFFRGKAKPHPLGSWESKDESQRAWESSFEERSNLLRVTRESFGAKKLLRGAGTRKTVIK